MKTKITLLIVLFLSFNTLLAQDDHEQDMNSLSIFVEYAKVKNYDSAYEPWIELRQRNPKFNNAINIYGERILKDKIKKSSGSEKVTFINDLVKLWEERQLNFASKTKKGEYLAKSCQLKYDNRKNLNISKDQLYNCFDTAYKTDSKTFTNPKSLYTYFSLMVGLYDTQKKSAQALFNKYDDISEKIESEIKNYTKRLNNLGQNEALNTKDKKRVKSYNSYIIAYNKIAGSVDSKLGERANCQNLIPLYNRGFEASKNDGVWLQRAMNRMFAKKCTDAPLFVKIVQQKNTLEPNASTSYYLGLLKDKEGKSSEALKYYKQAINLETDSYEKAKILYKIATKFKKSRSYGKARIYYRRALSENPSLGRAHLAIAQMYAASAKNCGADSFSKRTVYWLAAQEARKAGKVDASLKRASASTAANYLAKVPQKSEIFSSGRAGETIRIGCWIGASVRVPNL